MHLKVCALLYLKLHNCAHFETYIFILLYLVFANYFIEMYFLLRNPTQENINLYVKNLWFSECVKNVIGYAID